MMNTTRTGLFTPGKTLALLAIALVFTGTSSWNVQSVDAPDISHDGLHLDPDSKSDVYTYVTTGAPL
jgi:hypothetical protein